MVSFYDAFYAQFNQLSINFVLVSLSLYSNHIDFDEALYLFSRDVSGDCRPSAVFKFQFERP